MRGTIHLITAEDCLILRPLSQPVLDKELARPPLYGPALRGVDLGPPLAHARELLAKQPRTGGQLRAAFAGRFPDLDAAALTYACRNHLAFIQVPPRGVWGRTGGVRSTTAEAWLGRPVEEQPSIDDVMLELFDLPDAPRPDPDMPAAPRFLPEYDNVLLSHDDRSRFAGEPFAAPGPVHGTACWTGSCAARGPGTAPR